MKIIDLLNKIANGEEVPKKIFCFNREFYLEGNTYFGDTFTLMHYIQEEDLNDEVEILEEKEMCHKCHKYAAEYNQTYCEFCLGISKLEEKKIPEKLDWNKNDFTYPEGNLMDEETADVLMEIQDKINNIIDILNKGENK